MKRYLYLILLSAGINALSSCEKDVEVEMPEYTPVLVVNSFFEADSIPQVEVLFSRSILDTTSIKKLKTSQVDLYENNIFLGRMINDTTGSFTLPGFTPSMGKEYRLVVNQTGFDEIEAKTFCPVPVPLNTFSITKGAGTNIYNDPLAMLSVNFNDPSDKNYYFIRMNASRIDTFYLDSANYIVTPSSYDVYFEPGHSENTDENYINGGYMTSDELFNGRNYAFNLYFNQFTVEDTATDVFLYFSTVSKEYYDYFRTLNQQQLTSFNPFSEPVRVYSNITNGLGMFSGVTTQKYKIQ